MDRSSGSRGEIVIAAIRAGNVVLMVQPPRGFGENPSRSTTTRTCRRATNYLAAYRWIAATAEQGGFAAERIVHLGKHGKLEWLPARTLGMSASCGTDAALGDLPMIYPF